MDLLNKAFYMACAEGNVEVAKWLVSFEPKINVDLTTYHNNLDTNCTPFCVALVKGHLEVAKWLYEYHSGVLDRITDHMPILIDNQMTDLMHILCIRGDVSVMEWLHGKLKHIIQKKIKEDGIFTTTCMAGQIELAKFFNHHYASIIEENIHNDFVDVCESGLLEIAKWLYSIYPKMDINYLHEEYSEDPLNTPFVLACQNGYVEMAKWIYELKNNILTTIETKNFKEIFIRCCSKNKVNHEIIYFLHEIKPQLILENPDLFIYICQTGNIELAQWFLKTKPDTDLNMIDRSQPELMTPFMIACKSESIQLAKWLYELKEETLHSVETKYFNELFKSIASKSFNEKQIQLCKWLISINPLVIIDEINHKLFVRLSNQLHQKKRIINNDL